MSTLSVNEIEQKAENILKNYGVKTAKPDLKKLAMSLGILVDDSSNPGNDDISGMLVRSQVPRILINSSHPPKRQRFTLAHELAHFFLHIHDPMFVDGDKTAYMFRTKNSQSWKETEANIFAAALLMPRSLVKKSVEDETSEGRSGEDIIQNLAEMFGVSNQAMSFRLLNLGYDLYS